MLTDSCPLQVREMLFREAGSVDSAHASQLFLDAASSDLRDVLGRITQPTMYIGGRYNTVARSAQAWICEHIPDSRHVVFDADERGSHFMYLENPDRFNAEVADFLTAAG